MTNISINKLHEFKDHPYQVLDNDEMNNLIESVQPVSYTHLTLPTNREV